MDETKEQQRLHAFMQAIVYFTIAFEILLFVRFAYPKPVLIFFKQISHLPIYNNIFYSKLFTFFIIIVTAIGTKAQKNLELDPMKHIVFPLLGGFIIFFGGAFFLLFSESGKTGFQWYNVTYIIFSFIGAILVNTSLDNISKKIKSNFLKDPFNIENESFEQTKEYIDTPYSVNIPMKYYHKKKHHDGYINIVNPFRGTLLLGTPGSGKTYSVINSFIRQHSRKGFAMVVYDFKYPDLSRILFYHYLVNKKKGIIDEKFKFNVVNFSNVEYSRRINPLKREYIELLADAMETSEALYESLQKGDRGSSGNAEFFKTSAVNFLAACIYWWSRYKGGIYSDLPHVLSFINRGYNEIFNVLFSEPELQSILSPFKTAFDNKAFDQLEGQIGSLKIQISRLATKESFWVFSGDDFNLKVSDPQNPSYLVIANSPKTQSMNSALNALILNRLTRLVNTKGNLPTSIVVDEAPTLYFYQIANLLSTARSNKVSVLLGLQEIPQLEEQYGKVVSRTITSVIGNVVSGSARSKETLEWLQTLLGKVKQRKEGVSFQSSKTTISLNEQMDHLVPASKIAALQTGCLVGQVAMDFGLEEEFHNKENFPITMYNCKTNLNTIQIENEEKNYVELPKFYNFGSLDDREKKLQRNFMKIYDEVEQVVSEYTYV